MDKRKFNSKAHPTFIAKLRNVEDGKKFYHLSEHVHAIKTCDAYQHTAQGKDVIFGLNDLVEVWK